MMQKHLFLPFSFPILLILLSLPVSASNRMRSLSSYDANSPYTYNSMKKIFADYPTEAECRLCHEDRDSFPLLTHTNPDKHHLLVDSVIEEPVIAPYGVAGEVYECVSCHALSWSDSLYSYTVELTRDCLECHPVETITGNPRSDNVHHMTDTFDQFHCFACHSSGGRW